jgi:hypothetical protein
MTSVLDFTEDSPSAVENSTDSGDESSSNSDELDANAVRAQWDAWNSIHVERRSAPVMDLASGVTIRRSHEAGAGQAEEKGGSGESDNGYNSDGSIKELAGMTVVTDEAEHQPSDIKKMPTDLDAFDPSLHEGRVQVGDFTISDSDLVVFNLRHSLSRSMAVPSSDAPDAYSRVYAMMSWLMDYRGSEIPNLVATAGGFDPNNVEAIALSRKRESWSELFRRCGDNVKRIQVLFSATTKFSPQQGSESSKSIRVMELVRDLLPRYWLAWKILAVVVEHVDKIRPQPGEESVSLYDLLTVGDFGLKRSVKYFVPYDHTSLSGMRTTMIRSVFHRLLAWQKEVERGKQPPSIFSGLSKTLLMYFLKEEVPSEVDPEIKGYGCFSDKAAMLSFMLAVNEIECIQRAGAWIRTLIGRSTSHDMLERVASVSLQILGYDVKTALASPLASFSNKIIRSRVSISNMGSLAAVWLATHESLTPRQLLTAGQERTASLMRYAMVVPFVPTVIRACAARLGPDASASISTNDVIDAFTSIVHSAFTDGPGPGMGVSGSLSTLEDSMCSTIFFSVMNDSALSDGRAATWLSNTLKSGDDSNGDNGLTSMFQ